VTFCWDAKVTIYTENATGDVSLYNIAPYITSKLNRLNDITLKRIVGQPQTGFSFETMMNEQKIFLIKLGKGKFGKITASLLTNMIVSRFKLAAMKRAEICQEQRKDFFLYIDEAHNLPPENFMELLSEARKYNLGLVLATQYAAQLSKSVDGSSDSLLSALIGNVGQIISFRLGQQDAAALSPIFEPVFGQRDIISLPDWHAYVSMQQKNNSLAPFSLKTTVTPVPFNPETAREVAALSRMTYGMDKTAVDREIMKTRVSWKSFDSDTPWADARHQI
jgi:hypothetical protein